MASAFDTFYQDYHSKIKELGEFIKTDCYSDIEKWFKDQTFTIEQFGILHEILEKNHCDDFMHHPDYLDLMKDHVEYAQLVKERYLTVYRFFPFTEQMLAFHNMGFNLQWDNDMIYILNPNDNQRFSMDSPLLDKEDFLRILSDVFHREQFILLDKLEEFSQTSFLTYQVHNFHFNSQYGSAYFGDPENNKVFSLYQNIMCDYSEAKEDYLKKKGIALPDFNEAKVFENLLRKHSSSHQNEENYAGLFLNLKQYRTSRHFAYLNEAINQNAVIQSTEDTTSQKITPKI